MRNFIAIAIVIFLCLGLSPVISRAWDAGSEKCKHDVCSGGEIGDRNGKWRGNTHLWVVDQALVMLADDKSNDPIARTVVARMNKPGCRSQWEAGLWDVDTGYLAENIGARQRVGTHFYNPTGRDGFGKPTDVTTYRLLANSQSIQFGDARTNARYRLPGMLRRPGDNLPETNGAINGKYVRPPVGVTHLTDRDLLDTVFTAYYPGSFQDNTEAGDERCYDLGLALHYLTDTTQPMHSSGYDVFKVPTMLHAVFEEYTPVIQNRFPAGTWSKKHLLEKVKGPGGERDPFADEVFDRVGWSSNALAPHLLDVLGANGRLPTCTYDPEVFISYVGYCFRGRADVDNEIGVVLSAAYESVADYLWAAFNDEYRYSLKGRKCPPGTEYASNGMCYQECRPGYSAYGLRCAETCVQTGCTDTLGKPRDAKYHLRDKIPAKTTARQTGRGENHPWASLRRHSTQIRT